MYLSYHILQTLELIEIAEKEAALMGHVVKKTHKGELAVGDEDLSDLVQVGYPGFKSSLVVCVIHSLLGV